LVYLHEQGDSLSSIMEIAAQSEDYEHAGREMQPSSELFEMIAAQNRTISELQQQIQDLVNQLNKWIEHDMQKSQQQQEVIALMKSQKAAGEN